MIITLTISDGTSSVDVDFTYRTWVPGNDPWRARLPGYVGANSGDWSYNRVSNLGSFQVYGTPVGSSRLRWIMTLRGIPTSGSSLHIQAGDTGTGLHYISGVIIGDPLEWTCKSVT